MENTKNIHDGHRKRLKERFLKGGMDGLSDINCLELLLFYALPRRDTNPIAHALLEQFGSLSGVLDAPPEQLQKISGISEHAATLLHTIPQLARRYMMDQTGTDNILTTAKHGRGCRRAAYLPVVSIHLLSFLSLLFDEPPGAWHPGVRHIVMCFRLRREGT